MSNTQRTKTVGDEGRDETPGIKLRLAKDYMVQLTDRDTGRWLANVRWRPCGTMYVELSTDVRKGILTDNDSTDGI